MTYHYLYGSVKEVYRNVSFDASLPGEWKSHIPQNTESLLRMGGDGAIHHHSMMLLNVQGQSKLVRSCCVQQRNSKSPTFYVHKQVLDVTVGDLLEHFDDLLKVSFLTEAQFDAAADGQTVLNPGYQWDGSEEYLPIPDDVLRAVLYGMTDHWRIASDPVVIEVPAGEDYDRYTFRAVRTIYSCLPAVIRARAGFMTYTNVDQQLLEVALYFIPESAGYRNAIRLDGRSSRIEGFLNCKLPDATKDMLDRIVNLRNEELRTGSASKREAYLRIIAEDLETQMPMDSIKQGNYVSYMKQTELLFLKTVSQENFDKWVDFAKSCDPSSSQSLQKRLLKQMRSYMTEAVLDEYIFDEALKADCLASFREKLLPFADLFRCCETAASRAEAKAQTFFDAWAEVTQKLDTLESIHSLKKQLAGMNDLKTGYPTAKQLEAFNKKCDELWCNISVRLLEEYFAKSKERIKNAFQNQGDTLKILQATCREVLQEFENNIDPKLLLIEHKDRKEHITKLNEHYRKLMHALLKKKVLIDPALTDPITSEQMKRENERLDELRAIVRNFEIDAKIRQQLQTSLTESRQLLEKRYHQTPSYQSEQIDKAIRAENYFDKYELLNQLLERSDRLTEADKVNALKKVRTERPTDIAQYAYMYLKRYGVPISICAVEKCSPNLRSYIAADLEVMSPKSVEVQLEKHTLMSLLEHLQDYRDMYLYFAGKRIVSFELRYKKVLPDERVQQYVEQYNADELISALHCLQGAPTENKFLVMEEKKVDMLINQLMVSGILTDELLPGVVDGLFASNRTSSAWMLLQARLITKDYTMRFCNRRILILTCKKNGHFSDLKARIKEVPELEWLLDEVELLCREPSSNTKEQANSKKSGEKPVYGKILLSVAILLLTGMICFFLGRQLAPKPEAPEQTLPPQPSQSQTDISPSKDGDTVPTDEVDMDNVSLDQEDLESDTGLSENNQDQGDENHSDWVESGGHSE